LNASLEDKALELIKASTKGVLQSELWKELDIDSRKCSRVVAKLEADGKVKRTWETVSGTRTYRLSHVPQKKEAPKKEYSFDLILAEDEVAPCVGCTYECEPDYCPDLGNWIELLARDEAARLARAEKAARARSTGAKVIEEPAVPVEEEKAEEEEAPPAPPAKKARKGKAAAAREESAEPVKPAKPAEPAEPAEEEKPAKAPAKKKRK
jgi:hypothetical protein